MLKHILFVVSLGVLLREANANIECYLKKKGDKFSVPNDPNFYCSGYVNTTRDELKSCDVTKINLDKFESYVKEMCTNGSQLNKDMESTIQCWASNKNNVKDLLDCLEIVVGKTWKEFCKKRHVFNNCMKKLGEACGEAGVNYVTKGQDAEESYMKDICALVGGATLNSFFMWIVVLCVSFTILRSY